MWPDMFASKNLHLPSPDFCSSDTAEDDVKLWRSDLEASQSRCQFQGRPWPASRANRHSALLDPARPCSLLHSTTTEPKTPKTHRLFKPAYLSCSFNTSNSNFFCQPNTSPSPSTTTSTRSTTRSHGSYVDKTLWRSSCRYVESCVCLFLQTLTPPQAAALSSTSTELDVRPSASLSGASAASAKKMHAE
ncbi:hypothetical protein P154DRAFT_53729 [Amniculicola lignicola CBS 123094]|uniref:Uncharacterized protein n=1 Tax=Amniculicola lignicola CBS 123094 TaxID=1392246 RepID=A0A6A5WRR7_9PLEO|nr:hypothetical protein P154DRAFT_53729 [Amniculicola lignicola CBS 123094]